MIHREATLTAYLHRNGTARKLIFPYSYSLYPNSNYVDCKVVIDNTPYDPFVDLMSYQIAYFLIRELHSELMKKHKLPIVEGRLQIIYKGERNWLTIRNPELSEV